MDSMFAPRSSFPLPPPASLLSSRKEEESPAMRHPEWRPPTCVSSPAFAAPDKPLRRTPNPPQKAKNEEVTEEFVASTLKESQLSSPVPKEGSEGGSMGCGRWEGPSLMTYQRLSSGSSQVGAGPMAHPSLTTVPFPPPPGSVGLAWCGLVRVAGEEYCKIPIPFPLLGEGYCKIPIPTPFQGKDNAKSPFPSHSGASQRWYLPVLGTAKNFR